MSFSAAAKIQCTDLALGFVRQALRLAARREPCELGFQRAPHGADARFPSRPPWAAGTAARRIPRAVVSPVIQRQSEGCGSSSHSGRAQRARQVSDRRVHRDHQVHQRGQRRGIGKAGAEMLHLAVARRMSLHLPAACPSAGL
jgi:hypothetical protein